MTQIHEKLYWEAVRHYEAIAEFETDPLVANQLAAQSEKPFTDKLTLRAQFLDTNKSLARSLNTLHQRGFLSALVLFAFSFVLGIFAANSLLDTQTRVLNFYQLIVSFLGVNTLMLLLWLLSLMFKTQASPLSLLWKWLQTKLQFDSAKSASSKSALITWLDFISHSRPGQWLLHSLIHFNWVSFLLGAWLYTLFLMSTQQYQFVWESTLLSQDAFIALTNGLSALPNMVGFSTPNLEQIQGSELTPELASAAAWASLLSGCMLIYGIFPRLILALLSFARHRGLAKRWLPDFSKAYYQGLQQNLQNKTSTIVDPDLQAPVAPRQYRMQTQLDGLSEQPLVIALEQTSADFALPKALNDNAKRVKLAVFDRDSLATALQAASSSNALLLSDFDRLPDRGLTRTLSQFVKANPKISLLLVSQPGSLNLSDHDQRQRDWLNAAQHAKLPSEALYYYEKPST